MLSTHSLIRGAFLFSAVVAVSACVSSPGGNTAMPTSQTAGSQVRGRAVETIYFTPSPLNIKYLRSKSATLVYSNTGKGYTVLNGGIVCSGTGGVNRQYLSQKTKRLIIRELDSYFMQNPGSQSCTLTVQLNDGSPSGPRATLVINEPR